LELVFTTSFPSKRYRHSVSTKRHELCKQERRRRRRRKKKKKKKKRSCGIRNVKEKTRIAMVDISGHPAI
jgi:hypothetical protein